MSSLLGVSQRYLSSFIGERLIYDLRVAMYEHMQRIFEGAWSLDGAARDAFVADACGSDDALRRDVEALLSQQTAGEPFLSEEGIERYRFDGDQLEIVSAHPLDEEKP